MPRNEGEERRTRRNEEIEFRVYVNKYNRHKNRKKEINNDGLIVERGKGKRQYKNKWHSGQCNNAERAMQCREINHLFNPYLQYKNTIKNIYIIYK